MSFQLSLFKIGNFNFQLNHLLIISILVLSVTISFLIRSQSAQYGFELNEFDPFFNYRATQFILDNGISEYFQWNDDLSWYPNGRNVSATSQVMLHITAAVTYQIFGVNTSLYEFTILFPVIIGSLTGIIIFALVRLFAGTSAGLFASLLYAVSLPIILRGSLGWFKSEPLGLFYGFLGLYLFLSAIKSGNTKTRFIKIICAAIILSFGISSWGGIQFLIIPLGIFFLAVPFVRNDHRFLLWSIPLFSFVFLLISGLFERPGPHFVFGLGGFSLIVPTVFLISCITIQKISNEKTKNRNGFILLISVILTASFLIIINSESQFLSLPSFRYLNAINPFLTTADPLVDSVSEHMSTNISQSYLFHSILMIFAGIGAWFLLSNGEGIKNFVKNEMKIFVLIIGITGVYVSSAFVRLEVFASISIIILSSIGLSILCRQVFQNNSELSFTSSRRILKTFYLVSIILLLLVPLIYPVNGNWINLVDIPSTILNGGTNYQISTNDWKESLSWIKANTPKDAVIASWWDYGYWITTMSERATLADNATIDTQQIQKIAKILLSDPKEAYNMLKEIGATHVVIFVSGERLNVEYEGKYLYVLGGGGDESKKQWFMAIAGEPQEKYLHEDGFSGTDYFWNNTLLGNLIPFTTISYYDPINQYQSETFRAGYMPIFEKDVKYVENGSGHFKLIYASSSFTNEKAGPIIGIFVYELNEIYSE